MNKKSITRALCLAMIVCVLCALIIVPVGCTGHKEAIIILPGIMGSNIIDEKTGDPLWAPLEAGLNLWDMGAADYVKLLDKPEVQELLDLDGPKGGYKWIEKMKVNKDGTSNNKNTAQVLNRNGKPKYKKASAFGTLDYYKKTYDYLNKEYGDKYDVRMFEYDWRLDNMHSAEALEKFINKNHYESVVLVAHSMGGVLASTYIAKSQENANKVAKFISLGTPFFGAPKALRVAENPLSLVGDKQDLLNIVKNKIDGDNGAGSFDKFFNQFLDFVHDLPTIYQLIPYEAMCPGYTTNENSDLYGEGIVTIEGKSITKYDEFMEFMKGRSWINERCVNNMQAWQQEQFVDGTHASLTVDTVFFVGNDLDTECGIYFDYQKNMADSFYSLEGDGTVPLYSATCGLPLTDERVIEFKGVSHGNLSYDDVCLDKIKEVIDKIDFSK